MYLNVYNNKNIEYKIEKIENNDLKIEIYNYNEKNNYFVFTNLKDIFSYYKIELIDRKRLFFYSNGFQSWSYTKEYKLNESYEKLSYLNVFNKFVLRDKMNLKSSKNYHYSNFFTYFKYDNFYIGLIFIHDKITPPAIIYFNKKNLNIYFDFLYNNVSDLEGNFLANLLIIKANDFFEFKEKILINLSKFNLKLKFKENENYLNNFDNHIYGWESWYNHYSHIDKNIIINNLNKLLSTENIIKKLVQSEKLKKESIIFQIDDGWEKTVGEWDENTYRFPEGMKYIADQIKQNGFIPGIWIAPFVLTRFSKIYREKFDWVLKDKNGAPVVAGFIPTPEWGNNFYLLDISNNEVQDYLINIFDKIINSWGYKFLKLDFLYAGLLEGNFKNGKSAFYWYENILNKLTNFNAIFLGCGVPIYNAFKFFHINRIGADVKEKWDDDLPRLIRHQGRPSAYISLNNVINRTIFDKIYFYNDPDVFFARKNNIFLDQKEKELISVTNYIFGTQMMISDDLYDNDLIDIELTDKLIPLFEKLKNYQFSFNRISKDLYFIYSKNFELIGYINLSKKKYFCCIEDIYNNIENLISKNKDNKEQKYDEILKIDKDLIYKKLDKPLLKNYEVKKKIIFDEHSISIF